MVPGQSPMGTLKFLHTSGIHISGIEGKLAEDMDMKNQVSIDHASRIQWFHTPQPEPSRFKRNQGHGSSWERNRTV
jgi:hypothetical protein